MVLKDWKKVKGTKIDPRWSLNYEKGNKKLVVLRLGNGIYTVRVAKGFDLIVNKDLKTRTQAMKFAKEYMKRNNVAKVL